MQISQGSGGVQRVKGLGCVQRVKGQWGVQRVKGLGVHKWSRV